MYEIYTDGSSLGNSRLSGWSMVGDSFKLSTGQPNSTNNRVEMIYKIISAYNK